MASGINSTFRQVGIGTGIALLGALFTSRLTSAVAAHAAGTPFAAHSAGISAGLRNGAAPRLFAATPPQQRGLLGEVIRGSYTTALDHILLVAAIISFTAGRVACPVHPGRAGRGLVRHIAVRLPSARPPSRCCSACSA